MIIPARRPGHDRPPVLTDRIWIAVEPVYTREHSAPPSRYVFVYFVRIKNIGEETTQLFWRHWKIHDPAGGDQEVEGRGGCGRVPHLGAGRCARVLQLLRLGGKQRIHGRLLPFPGHRRIDLPRTRSAFPFTCAERDRRQLHGLKARPGRSADAAVDGVAHLLAAVFKRPAVLVVNLCCRPPTVR